MNRYKYWLVGILIIQMMTLVYLVKSLPICPKEPLLVPAPFWLFWKDQVLCYELLITNSGGLVVFSATIYTVIMACFPDTSPVAQEMRNLLISRVHTDDRGKTSTWRGHVMFFLFILVAGNGLLLPWVTILILIAAQVAIMTLTRKFIRHIHFEKLRWG